MKESKWNWSEREREREGERNDELMKLMTNIHTTNVSSGFSNQEVGPSSLIDSFFCFKQARRQSKAHFSRSPWSDSN